MLSNEIKLPPDMIFIVGNSRSGTTMMSRILGQHSAIFTFNELHFVESIVSPEQINSDYRPLNKESESIVSSLLRSQREGTFSSADKGQYIDEANSIINCCTRDPSSMDIFKCFCLYETSQNNKKIACEQTPKNIYYVNEILKTLPNSKFINMYRDPRDVLLSQKQRWKRRFLGAKQVPFFSETLRSWFNYHPITMSKLWNSAINESLAFNDVDNFLNVKFETLLNNPEGQIKKICEFLTIDYEEAMINVPKVGSSSLTDKSSERGIDKARQGTWNNGGLTKGEIGICQKICRTKMRKLGYESKEVKVLWFWWAYYGVLFIFKMTGALIFNLNRTKKLFSTIKRRIG